MKVFKFLKGAAFGLACLGMVIPQSVLTAAPQNTQAVAKVKIADVSLTQGVLTGKVVNSQGQFKKGAVIKVSLGNQEVAKTVSSENGDFAIRNLSNGVYQVSTGQTTAAVRLWEGQSAPPAAKKKVLLVEGNVTRAQLDVILDPFDYLLLGLGLTGVVLGGAALADDGETIIVSP